MTIDTGKIGIAAAKAMDYIEKIDDVEEYTLDDVGVIVALNKSSPTENEPDRVETIFYYACTDERVYVKEGLLAFASDLSSRNLEES